MISDGGWQPTEVDLIDSSVLTHDRLRSSRKILDSEIELSVQCYNLTDATVFNYGHSKYYAILSVKTSDGTNYVHPVKTEVVASDSSPAFVTRCRLPPVWNFNNFLKLSETKIHITVYNHDSLVGQAVTCMDAIFSRHENPELIPLLASSRNLLSPQRGLFGKKIKAGEVDILWDVVRNAPSPQGVVNFEVSMTEAFQEELGRARSLRFVLRRSACYHQWIVVYRSESFVSDPRAAGCHAFRNVSLNKSDVLNGEEERLLRLELHCRHQGNQKLLGYCVFRLGSLYDYLRGTDYLRWIPSQQCRGNFGLQLTDGSIMASKTEIKCMFVKAEEIAESRRASYSRPLVNPALLDDVLTKNSGHSADVESAAALVSRQLGLPNRSGRRPKKIVEKDIAARPRDSVVQSLREALRDVRLDDGTTDEGDSTAASTPEIRAGEGDESQLQNVLFTQDSPKNISYARSLSSEQLQTNESTPSEDSK